MPDQDPFFNVSYFARANFRNDNRLFGIKQADRMFHFYVFGKSGSGKTTLLKTLMLQDVKAGRGFCFLDVHGDASREIITEIKQNHPDTDHIYFDVTNPEIPFGYNPLRRVSSNKRSLVASNILEIFQRQWKSAWGMKMEHILRMVLLTLLDQPKANFSDILKILYDKEYQRKCLLSVQSEPIRLFWREEFTKYKPNDLLPILNKLGGFLSHSIVRRTLVENDEQISLRKVIDEGTILVLNLAKGQVGFDVANILGGLLLTSLASATFSRIDMPEEDRIPYFLYIDEFQTISGNELISELLAQVRKFRLGLYWPTSSYTNCTPTFGRVYSVT